MVVFTGSRADTAAYRRPIVGVRTEEANDVAMLAEVLKRRVAREKTGDTRIAMRPDLVIIDGGIQQLNAAEAMFAEMGICKMGRRERQSAL